MQSCETIERLEIDGSMFGDLLAVLDVVAGFIIMTMIVLWLFAGWLLAGLIGHYVFAPAGLVVFALWLWGVIDVFRGTPYDEDF